MDADLRRSPLDDRHRALGATLVPFAGWEMPIDYGSVVAEHRAVRESCGVFDLSHLGTLVVRGEGAVDCLQRALTNDLRGLGAGQAIYTLCLDDEGGIVDDLIVYALGWGYLVVPNAANAAAVTYAIRLDAGEAVEVADVKPDMACVAVQGPESPKVLAAAGVDVGDLGFFGCAALGDGVPPEGGVLARTGYTGERGYELFVPAADAGALWDRVAGGGATPAGLGARDTLRLEMGYPLHGNDISPSTTPAEARLGWACKGSGYRGEEAYLRAKEAGPAHRLRGLRATGRGIPRAGCTVRSPDGSEVGELTSGTFSPTLRVGIAMGYLDAGLGEGDEVVIDVRGKDVPAEVVRPPFVDADPKR